MRKTKKNDLNRGLVRTIVLIMVALIVLAYFGFNLRAIVGSTTFVDNWSFIKSIVSNVWSFVWTDYLRAPIGYLWSNVFIPYVWEPIVENLAKPAS